MTTPLPLARDLQDRETAFSFVSRLAAMNGVDTAGFCTDMGLPFSKVIDGNPEALARLADLSATEVEDLRLWSPLYLGNREHEFRGNRLHAKAIKESTVRGCPACLREDAAAAPGRAEGDMYIRGHWLFRPVTLCLKHHHPLVPLWTEANVSRRYDAFARLAEIAPGVWAGELDKELRAPNPFDEWIEARLAGTPTESWLDQFDLYAAAHFCELLGRAIWAVRFPKWKKFGPERAWMSFEMGFRFATQGEATVRDTLMQLQETIGEPTDGPKKKYGALYDRLAFDLLGEAYAPFRELLRDHIASTWPLGPGDDLMGEPVLERKVHSVRTAARELGMDPRRLRKLLVDVDLVQPAETGRDDQWELFDAKAAQPHLDRINHIHHAGNSSGIVDGAAGILIGSKAYGEAHGLKPRAVIRATAKIGTDPTIMLTGPVPVTEKILVDSGMSISDIDLFEVNEAFAAVVLRFMQAFNVDDSQVNVNGGSIAMGHPLGATGAIIIGTLLDELERSGKGTGLATLCVASGMGAATIIERV